MNEQDFLDQPTSLYRFQVDEEPDRPDYTSPSNPLFRTSVADDGPGPPKKKKREKRKKEKGKGKEAPLSALPNFLLWDTRFFLPSSSFFLFFRHLFFFLLAR